MLKDNSFVNFTFANLSEIIDREVVREVVGERGTGRPWGLACKQGYKYVNNKKLLKFML